MLGPECRSFVVQGMGLGSQAGVLSPARTHLGTEGWGGGEQGHFLQKSLVDEKIKNIIDESNAYLIIVGNCGLSGVIQDVLENNIL